MTIKEQMQNYAGYTDEMIEEANLPKFAKAALLAGAIGAGASGAHAKSLYGHAKDIGEKTATAVEKTYNGAKDFANDTVDKAKKGAKEAVSKADNAIGVSEAKTASAAKKNAKAILNEIGSNEHLSNVKIKSDPTNWDVTELTGIIDNGRKFSAKIEIIGNGRFGYLILNVEGFGKAKSIRIEDLTDTSNNDKYVSNATVAINAASKTIAKEKKASDNEAYKATKEYSKVLNAKRKAEEKTRKTTEKEDNKYLSNW